MPPLQLTLFIASCLLIGLAKGGLGGSLPIALIVPTLSLVMDAADAVVLILPFLIVADWFALYAYWQKWDLQTIKLMMPLSIIGIIMGAMLLTTIPDDILKIIIGIVTIIAIIYKILSDRLQNITYTHRNWHGHLAAWVSAFASTLASNGGPSFTIYLLLQRLNPVTFIATTTLYFAIINMLKLPIFWQQGLLDLEMLLSVIWVMPILPVGVYIGRRSLDYINQQAFERIMLGLLALSVVILFTTL